MLPKALRVTIVIFSNYERKVRYGPLIAAKELAVTNYTKECSGICDKWADIFAHARNKYVKMSPVKIVRGDMICPCPKIRSCF